MGKFDTPLGNRSDHLGEVRLPFCQLPGVVVRRDNDHRCAGREGILHQADTVGQAAVDVEAHECGTSGRTRVGIAHSHGDSFLQGEDVFKLRIVLQSVDYRPLASTRVAEDVLDPFSLEHLQ